MDFELSAEHRILRDTVRAFAESEIRPVARELDDREEFSVELTKKMGELGLFGIVVPEEYGGQGMNALASIIAIEELARVDGSQAATVAAGNALGIGAINAYGSEQQKRKYLPALCGGKSLWGFALTEPGAGSDLRSIQTRAVESDRGWTLNGSKTFTTNASSPISIGVSVLAVTGGHGREPELSLFLAEHGTPGFEAVTMHGKLGWRASDTAELSFTDCTVPSDAILGTRGGRIPSRGRDARRRPARNRRHGLGCRPGGVRGCACACEGSNAVRPPDRQVPGSLVSTRRHVHPDRACAHVPVPCGLAT